MAILCFLKDYNKYFNRIIKRPEIYTDIISNEKVIFNNINFIPNDGVTTEQIINWSQDWSPDYMVILNANPQTTEEEVRIIDRWFVLECDRTRKQQYNIKLRRDLVANNYDNLKNCIANIDRCVVPDNNPLIYNKEPFEYNQIKTDEIPIYDRTICPWIVGYIDNDGTVSYTDSSMIVLSEDYDIDLSNVNYEDWAYSSYIGADIKNNIRLVNTSVTISWDDFWGAGIIGGYAIQNEHSSWYNAINGQVGTANEAIRYSKTNFNTVKNDSYRHTWYSWSTANARLLENITEDYILTNSDISNLRSLNGMKVKFANGIYRINFTANGSSEVSQTKQDNTLATYILDSFQSHISGSKKHNYLNYTYAYDKYLLTTESITSASTSGIEFVMTQSTNKLKDAPYRMFAIPVPNVNDAPSFVVTYASENRYYCDRDILLTLVQHMIRDLGDHLYDIQLLPYCPVAFNNYSYNSTNNTSYANMPLGSGGSVRWTKDIDYGEVILHQGESSYYRGIVVYPKESSFKFTLDKTLYNGSYQSISGLFEITNKKIQNETEFARLCSPNYASAFEFSPAKNEGVKAVNIACTYKPYNPFVVVAPQFEGLYGKDYNDNRGLILAGDFSLAQIGDAWISFQINNKAYSESFRREIQSMEKEYNIQNQEAGWQIFGGTVSGAASGALAGGIAGGGYGAVAGAAVGGLTSLAGGIVDYANLEARQTEALNYKKDMFRFQLQNIKAQPDTLEKTSAINANSKYVPFIEKYSSTDEEKQLLEDYLTYNGYSAGFCGPITTSGYVRANIIRFNDPIDEHELAELNVELKKGVYI